MLFINVSLKQSLICRYVLGIGWRSSKLCALGWKCNKKSKGNSKGTITKEQSIFLKKYHDALVQIGSGMKGQ